MKTITNLYSDTVYYALCRRKRCDHKSTEGKTSSKDVRIGCYSAGWAKWKQVLLIHACYEIKGRTLHLSRDHWVIDGLILHETKHVIPVGWKWVETGSGIAVQKRGDEDVDYHPTRDEWDEFQRGLTTVSDFCQKAIDNASKRRQFHRNELQIAELINNNLISVSIYDSIRSGNCAAGTIEYCRQHGYSTEKSGDLIHVNAKLLNKSSNRVQSAIRMAVERATCVQI